MITIWEQDYWKADTIPWEAPIVQDTICPKCGAETMGTNPPTCGLFVACANPECNRHIIQPEPVVKRSRWMEWLEWLEWWLS
jgi:hypothetical protein